MTPLDELLQRLAHPALGVEAAALAGCLALAFTISWLIGRRHSAESVWFGRATVDGLLFALLALVFTYSASLALRTAHPVPLLRMAVPVIARVHGIATAAGCQLVAQCDLAVAAQEAKFAVSGINYGLFCSTPSVPLLRNVPPKQAMEMLVTGEFISAQQAMERGLVNRVVPADRLDAEIEKLVASILAKPRAALAMGKELFYRQRELGIEAAYQLANQTMAVNMMNECALEGFTAFAQKREPAWKA